MNRANVLSDSDSSGNNVKISVNTQRQQPHGGTVVTVNGGAPLKRVNKPINNSIIFLGDCEMPITKSVTRKNSGSDSGVHKGVDNKGKENYPKKIANAARPNGELKQHLASSSQQTR